MSLDNNTIDCIHIGYHKCASTTLQRFIYHECPTIDYTREARVAVDSKYNIDNADWHMGDSRKSRLAIVSSEGLCGVDYNFFYYNERTRKF